MKRGVPVVVSLPNHQDRATASSFVVSLPNHQDESVPQDERACRRMSGWALDRSYAVGDLTLTLTLSLKGEGIAELRKSYELLKSYLETPSFDKLRMKGSGVEDGKN